MKPLRVAIHVDAPVIERWKASVVAELASLDGVRTTVHRTSGHGPTRTGGRLAAAIERLDRRRFRQVDDATDLVDVPAAAADEAPCTQPDVAIWLGAGPAPPVPAGRHGVWEFRFSDGLDQPGLVDVLEGRHTSHSALVDATDGTTLYESWAAVDHLSPHRHRHAVCWKSARFPARVLTEWCRTGHLRRSPPGAPPAAAPGTGALLRLVVGHVVRYGTLRVRERRAPEAWRVGVERKGVDDVVADARLNVWALLEPPSGCTWADPSVVAYDDRVWVFVEEVGAQSSRGHITVIEVSDAGAAGPPRVALAQDCHLSYPHVFGWDGDLWMVPESSEAREVVLYRCERFPDRWVRDTVLLADSPAADATLYHDDRGWWMFAAVPCEGQLHNWEELHLFHAEELGGPWTPHPANPVVSDCRRARPAGRLFELDGVLYRPGQNCSPRYGTATVLSRVDELSLDAYVESPVQEIHAGQLGAHRTHTLDVSGPIVAYDIEGRTRA